MYSQQISLQIKGPLFNTSETCAPILKSLSDWFGIEEAVQHYLEEIERLPTFLAYRSDDVVGFLSIKQHFPHAAEIYVMGTNPDLHRQGIGRELLETAQTYLRAKNVEYLQVKTLSPSREDENYARTRKFYTALGFRPLEEFKDLWGSDNPCLLMIKRL